MPKLMIGEIMIAPGYIWVEHIVDARRHQMACPEQSRGANPPTLKLLRAGPGKRIGECLKELGYIDGEKIRTALMIQERGNTIMP